MVDQVFFPDVGYVDLFRRYLRSKSKVVRNSAEIWTFFCPPKFLGRAFHKLYACYHPYLASRRLEKFREDTPPSPEIIEAHTLIFKPNFKFSQLKFFGGTPSQLGCALASLGQSLSHVKVQVAEPPNGRNVVSRKISIWVGQYEPIELFCLWTKVYQSFFHPTWNGLWLIKFFSDVRYVNPFRRYSR